MNESYNDIVLIIIWSCAAKKEERIRTCDWETAEAPFLLQSLDFLDGLILAEDNRVEDEAILVTLDLLDHLCLLVWRAVVVNNTETTLESHGDGHLVLSDSVHRRRNEWGLENNSLGHRRLEADRGCWESNVAGENQEIVICKTSVLLRVEEALNIEAIAGLVLVLQDLQGLARIEGLLALCETQSSGDITVRESHVGEGKVKYE